MPVRRLVLIANPSASGFTGAGFRRVVEVLSSTFDVVSEWPEDADASRMCAAKAAADGVDYDTPGGNGGITLNGTRGVMLFQIVGDGMNNPPDQTIPNHVGNPPTFADAPPGVVP